MKLRILAAALLCALSTISHAQSPGLFPSGTVYGNSAASTAVPSAQTVTSMLDRALCSTNNSAVARLSGSWACLASANNSVWVTNGSGVPSLSTTLPSALTIPSPALTGTPTAPTAAYGTSTTQIATTAFVQQNGSPNVYPINTASCPADASSECTDFGVKLAACEAAGGGRIVFPHGYFLMNAGYTAAGACIVEGQGWQTFLGTGTTSSPGTIGTYFKQTSAGSANVMLTISTGSNGFQLRDVAFWQVQPADTGGWAPTAYQPVVINLTDGTKFDNILLFGTTQGIQLGRLTPTIVGSGNVTLTNIQGVCFSANGCIRIMRAGDFVKVNGTYFNSSVIGTTNTNMIAYAQANTAVIRSERADSPTISGHSSFEFRYCVLFSSNAEGYTSRALVSDLNCDHHQISVLVTGASTTAEIANTHMTGTTSSSRGVQCASSCIVHISNTEIDTMQQAAIWAEAADANIAATNLTVNGCNASNSGWAPVVADNVAASATVNGMYIVTGTFCLTTNTSGPGVFSSGYGRFVDTSFSLIDNADNTKVGAFQLSGLTTGTTRAWTVPDGNFTFSGINLTETFTGIKTFGSAGAVGRLKVAGTTSGAITLDAAAVAGTNTLTLPAATDTLVGKATTDTLTNKTINSASGVNTIQFNGQTANNFSGSGNTMLFSTNPEIAGALRLAGSSSQVALLQASATAGNVTQTLSAQTGVVAVTQDIGTIRYRITGVNFNSANTDNAMTITLPTGVSRWSVTRVMLTNASASISTATVGVFTSTGGGGQTIAANQAITVTASAADTNNNMMQLTLTNANSMAYNDTTIQVRVGTAQGSAATADIVLDIYPH